MGNPSDGVGGLFEKLGELLGRALLFLGDAQTFEQRLRLLAAIFDGLAQRFPRDGDPPSRHFQKTWEESLVECGRDVEIVMKRPTPCVAIGIRRDLLSIVAEWVQDFDVLHQRILYVRQRGCKPVQSVF